jgi:FtsH-binding integral membrane protein
MDNQEETANLVTGEAVSSLETKLHSNSRQGFIAKVYSIICFQLLLTAAAVIVTLQSPVIKAFLWKQWWLIIIAFVVQIVTMLMILCCQGISRNVPTNYIVLTIFTLAECYVV